MPLPRLRRTEAPPDPRSLFQHQRSAKYMADDLPATLAATAAWSDAARSNRRS
uniref:Uncharacterized protein n=1 Tax=Arundo donax TaxID=35708 RepID=A0A0A9FRH0_ARUDO